jgi:hypothetical protein
MNSRGAGSRPSSKNRAPGIHQKRGAIEKVVRVDQGEFLIGWPEEDQDGKFLDLPGLEAG